MFDVSTNYDLVIESILVMETARKTPPPPTPLKKKKKKKKKKLSGQKHNANFTLLHVNFTDGCIVTRTICVT